MALRAQVVALTGAAALAALLQASAAGVCGGSTDTFSPSTATPIVVTLGAPSKNYGWPDSPQGLMFQIDVPEGATSPSFEARTDDWLDTAYVWAQVGKEPTSSSSGYYVYLSGSDGDGVSQSLSDDYTGYTVDLQQGTNYVFVCTTSSFGKKVTVEASEAAFTPGTLAAIIILPLLFCCGGIGLYTVKNGAWPSSQDNEQKLVINMFASCVFMTFTLCLTPLIFLIVGLAQLGGPVGIGPIFAGVGGGLMFLFGFGVGHRTLMMDANTKTFTMYNRRFVVIPSKTTKTFDEIASFAMSSQLGSKGSVLYQMKLNLTGGGELSLEMGASNVAVGTRKQAMAKCNKFLARFKAPGTVPDGVEVSGIGGLLGGGGLAGGAVAQQRQMLAMQQQMLAMQQQQAAMAGGGAAGGGAPGGGMPGAYAGGGAPGAGGTPAMNPMMYAQMAAAQQAAMGGMAGMPAGVTMPPGTGSAAGGASGAYTPSAPTAYSGGASMPPGYGGGAPGGGATMPMYAGGGAADIPTGYGGAPVPGYGGASAPKSEDPPGGGSVL